MKALEGRLPVNTTYSVVEYNFGTLENGTTCQNCGQLIANTAELKNAEGRTYIVGQDCAEKLITTGTSGYWQLMQTKKEFNRKRNFVRKYQKALKEGLVKVKDSSVYFYGTDGVWSSRYNLDYSKRVLAEANIII